MFNVLYHSFVLRCDCCDKEAFIADGEERRQRDLGTVTDKQGGNQEFGAWKTLILDPNLWFRNVHKQLYRFTENYNLHFNAIFIVIVRMWKG